MKKMASIFMATILLLSVTGCGSKDTVETDASTSKGDLKTVTLAKENDIISLNTMYATDGMSFEVINTMIDGLMTTDKDDKIVPAVAENYTESEDGLTYTFNIRPGITWSNGAPVTAHDFEFAWKSTISNPAAEYSYIYTQDGACILNADQILYEGADVETLGVKAIDDLTLEVKLSKKTPYFLSLMGFPVFYPINEEFFVSQGDGYGFTADSFISNGPFLLKTWEKDTKIELVKNPTYYDADAIKIDELEFRITPEVSTGVTAFEAGTVDYAKLSNTLIDKYKNTDEYVEILDAYLWYLQVNDQAEVFKGDNLQLALAYAIDKEDLTQNVLKDGSVPVNGFVPYGMAPSPEGEMFRDTTEEYLVPDKALAQEYFAKALEEAGTDTINITLLYENADPAKSAAEYLQGTLQAALPGLIIDMNVQPKENRIELQKQFDFEVSLTRWGPDYDDPTTYLNLLLENNIYNYGKYEGPEFNETMEMAANAATPEERWELLKEAEAFLMEDAPVIPIFQTGAAALLNPKVTGIRTQAVGVPFIYTGVEIID
ncbi:hypothetical protein AN639_06000 [Candidatus Epulonipiscium fishelsonii]|uniref:Uncharacterized protein n=1 Tax=Candidatus Epulonipiscium fishelsonii TaxID=77094 RepID=A0ACC8XDU6_9FIRM|nr:hypothetical protein AN639_06000 [Epulopiscium sp. SCG-B05WGA-EpuloA1]ONI41064.1 hypothetical protein AN396_04755 [Epulopiscium sp. SCG-B11WGA-EpuloA1]